MKQLRFALVLMLALVLTACQALPTAGPVTGFERDIPNSESLVLKGFGPVEDAPPDVIVRDFLRASAAGWSDDFQVARAYLTEDAKAAWRPETQVQIYSDDQTPNMISEDGKVQVSVAVGGVVTPDGKYAMQAKPSNVHLDYNLVQNADGQWRIDRLPDGVLISQSSFHAVYTLASVYFLSPDMTALVPDPRWYPGRRLASYLMQGLIEGPSPQIATAVVSAVPAGARLPLQQVEVFGGRAEVRLEGEDLSTPEQQSAFKWQVNATLMQVPSVSEVSIRNNETSLDDVSVPAGPAWAMDSRAGISKDGLVLNDGSEPVLMAPIDEMGKSPRDPSVGPVDSSPLAFISGDQLYGVHQAMEPRAIYTADNLSRPSVDRLGWIWTTTGNKVVVASLYTNTPIALPSPWTSGDPLRAIAITPDGARALLLRGGPDGSVWYAGVKRSADGTPIGLDSPSRIEVEKGKILDASWAGNTSALILQEGAEQRQVTISTLASLPETLRAPADAVRISGGATPQSILLGNGEGAVYSRSGASWRNETSVLQGETYPH
ncbi:MAG: LpqB family beta-propeller domain-containing protein [Actinomycetaceae bacterium]|nr:LpqB family beta-propeller domain-containing protein [Actinomycetaceae bacterium]